MPDILNIINTIRDNGSTEYTARIPVATRDNIEAIGTAMLTYQSTGNEFLSALINKVAFQVLQSRVWANPLALLKKGTKPFGSDIENVYTNPATDQGFDPAGATLLTVTKPDTKTEYFRTNREGMYRVTITRARLRRAFTNLASLEEFLNYVITTLYSGDYIDEFILMKNSLAEAIQTQRLMTVGVTAITTEATAKDFIVAVKSASTGFTYPSAAYNAYKKVYPAATAVTTWTPKENQVLLIRSSLLDYIDVNVLAAAFNMDRVTFMGRVIPVDNFGSMTNVEAILMDESILQVWDEMNELTEFFNPQGLYWTYFWHHHQIYGVSILANAIAFVNDATAPAAPVITAPGAGDTEVTGTGEAGAEVYVTIGAVTIHAAVPVGGAWTVAGFAAMTQGDKVNAYQVDDAGNKSVAATEATVTA